MRVPAERAAVEFADGSRQFHMPAIPENCARSERCTPWAAACSQSRTSEEKLLSPGGAIKGEVNSNLVWGKVRQLANYVSGLADLAFEESLSRWNTAFKAQWERARRPIPFKRL